MIRWSNSCFWLGLEEVSRDESRKLGARECEMRFEPEPTGRMSVMDVLVGDLNESPTWTNK
jgi:hypothetical protein